MTESTRLVLEAISSSSGGMTEHQLYHAKPLARKVKAKERARLAQQMVRMGLLREVREEIGEQGGRPWIGWQVVA